VKRTALIATAALFAALTPLAAAGTRIQSVDASSFPALRVIVVAPIGAKTTRISENGHPVSGVTAVNLGGTKSIVLAIDRSQSMRGRPLSNALAAAQSFVGAARAQDHVGVVAFGRSAVGLTRISATPAEARDQLAGMTVDPKAGTALYDAIVVAADRLGQDERPGRAIVVVTDGKDVSSLHSLKDAIRAAQNARTAVYTIGIAGPAFTPTALREIAKQTGGSYREASSSRELTATYAALRSELAHTWQVSYLTSARPGATISLTAAVAKQGRARFTTTLPTEEASSADKPTSLIPAIGYDAAGTAVIGLVVGGLILLACFFWYASQRESRIRSRIDPHLATEAKTGKARRQQSRAATRAHLVDSIENVFANVRQFKQIAQMIERADLPLRPGELLAICAGAAFLLGVVAAVAGASSLVILALMAAGGGAPVGVVAFKARTRTHRFENQLPDLLITLAASLKAGHSFRQGIQSVVEEGAEPASDEFKRVLTETQLGKPMDDALSNMAARVGSKNFTFVVTAVTIQRQIGGSLAGLFDMVAETVRQRQQFARKVKGLTAMGRMSAYVLVALPFFLAAIITLMNPVYMAPLWHSGTGHKLVMGGLVMITIGSLMLRKIASFRG
jgi:tight adherence protein B